MDALKEKVAISSGGVTVAGGYLGGAVGTEGTGTGLKRVELVGGTARVASTTREASAAAATEAAATATDAAVVAAAGAAAAAAAKGGEGAVKAVVGPGVRKSNRMPRRMPEPESRVVPKS